MDRTRSSLALVLLTAALATGCLPDGAAPEAASEPPGPRSPAATPSTPTAAPQVPASPSPSAPPSRAPADEGLTSPVLDPGANTRPATGEAVGDAPVALLREVRVGAHDGFDRIVFEFADDSAPDYRVEYVDEPIREDGSGFVVPVAGDAWLSISLQGASGHTREAPFRQTYEGPRRRPTPRLENVLELVSTGDFEAVMSWHAGVRTPEPFTVRTLRQPARIVVDVRQP